MKPQIIFVDRDGKLDLTKEELKRMLEEVYSQGFADGKASVGTITTQPYWKLPQELTCSSVSGSDVNLSSQMQTATRVNFANSTPTSAI